MKETDEKQDRTQIATTTIIISIVVVLLYFAARYAGKNLLEIDITDTSAIFLSLIPFVIYLVVSGRITELKGGGFEIKFREAVGEKVLFEHLESTEAPLEFTEVEPMTKAGRDRLTDMIAMAAVDPSFTLSLSAGIRYSRSLLGEYLKELSELEIPQYVVLVDRNERFEGFVSMSSLSTSLMREDRGIIDVISTGDLDRIPGFRRDFIQDAVSNKEALNILEDKKITEIAVVDANRRFRGFTDKNTIMLSIVRNLLSKI